MNSLVKLFPIIAVLFARDGISSSAASNIKNTNSNNLCNFCKTIKSPLNNIPNVPNVPNLPNFLTCEPYESIKVESSDNESIISSENINLSRGIEY